MVDTVDKIYLDCKVYTLILHTLKAMKTKVSNMTTLRAQKILLDTTAQGTATFTRNVLKVERYNEYAFTGVISLLGKKYRVIASQHVDGKLGSWALCDYALLYNRNTNKFEYQSSI